MRLRGQRFSKIASTAALAMLLAVSARASVEDVAPRLDALRPTPDALKGLSIDQNLGAHIAPDLEFKDEAGQPIRLGDYFGKRPIVLTLNYFECPMLCTAALNDLTRQINGLSSLHCGKDFDILTVSFNPNETPDLAAKKKASYLHQCIHPEETAVGWHFLTGTEDNIRKLTDTVGFHFKYDEATKSYAHASGIMILKPDGQISRYFYGTQFEAIEIAGAVRDAQAGVIGKPATVVLFYCFQYDPSTGKVGLVVTRAVRVAGVMTVLMLGSFVVVMLRRDHRRPPTDSGSAAIV